MFAGTVKRILRPNYPGRKTRLSRRPLGNTHHGSLQITSLRECVTSSKQLTLTVDSHWRGCEQQRAGELGRGGGRKVGGAERGGRGDDGAPDTAGARRGGAVSTSSSQPRAHRLLPEPREPQQLRAAAAGLCAPARSPPPVPPLVRTQPAAISFSQPLNSLGIFSFARLSRIFSTLCFLNSFPLSLATLSFFSSFY